jgi:hypothetical protein
MLTSICTASTASAACGGYAFESIPTLLEKEKEKEKEIDSENPNSTASWRQQSNERLSGNGRRIQ